MLRKRLTILAVAAMLLASVGVFSAPALADVHPNAHNCAGFISTIAPEDVNRRREPQPAGHQYQCVRYGEPRGTGCHSGRTSLPGTWQLWSHRLSGSSVGIGRDNQARA